MGTAMRVEKTVFISYRRANIYTARAVCETLSSQGYDVFLHRDYPDVTPYKQLILNQIAARAHFVVILTPSAIKECTGLEHWLRDEIVYALDMKRHILPLMYDWFTFKNMRHCLIDQLALLPEYTALEISLDTFREGLARLDSEFLNAPVAVELQPTPGADEPILQLMRTEQPPVSDAELEAEQWFERGNHEYIADNAGMIADFSKAIELNPLYAEAYYSRGIMRSSDGDDPGAAEDFDQAIQLDPQYSDAYRSRSSKRYSAGDTAGAMTDASEAIRLNPADALAYMNRGLYRKQAGDMQDARADFDEMIRLKPQYRNLISE